MTDKELRELESLAVDQDRLFDPAAVIALIAEVRRLNRMVDKSCEMLINKFWCANALGLPAFTNCPPDDDEGDCLDCVRKYLESED